MSALQSLRLTCFRRSSRAQSWRVACRSMASKAGGAVPSTTPRKLLTHLRADQLRGKNVLVRVDFNVPLSKSAPIKVSDDTRIRESLPTIETLSLEGARVILASHLGRPKGDKEADAKLRMWPVALKLAETLKARHAADVALPSDKDVLAVNDCIGPDVTAAVKGMKDGQILVLENVRFRKAEEGNDAAFAEQLARDTLADVYVNDAFGTAHRAHASTAGVRPFVKGPAVGGFLMQKELNFLYKVRDKPSAPYVAVMGGAKVSDKIKVIEALLNRVNTLVIGGGMSFPFLRAKGYSVGASKNEESHVATAKSLLELAASKNVKIVLPTDVVIAKEFKNETEFKTVSVDAIPDGWMALDIGPKSVADIQAALKPAKTVFWNGPMGVFEFSNFAQGTLEVAKAIAALNPTAPTADSPVTVVGGGDSVAALQKAGPAVVKQISHISTGGGASLELLEGAVLPGVEALDEAPKS